MGMSAQFRNLGKKIICVGRNYKDHALELGNPLPKKPMLFMKATSTYVDNGGYVVIPDGCKNLNQEVEFGVIIGKVAKNVKKSDAMDYVGGYTVALDMTARDFQDDAKKSGSPWFLAKSFDTSCPVADFINKNDVKFFAFNKEFKIANPHEEEIYCKVNGVIKQQCRTSAMIFDIPTLIEFASKYVTLEVGDLLLTGTPAGVCSVNPGDVLEFGITGKITATVTIKEK